MNFKAGDRVVFKNQPSRKTGNVWTVYTISAVSQKHPNNKGRGTEALAFEEFGGWYYAYCFELYDNVKK